MSSAPTKTTAYMWDYPIDAHLDFAKAEAEKVSLQKALGSEVTGADTFIISSSTQVAVTNTQHSAHALLFGTAIKKDGAFIEEPPFYHTRLLGTVRNPWDQLFGSSTHLAQQQQLLQALPREQALLGNELLPDSSSVSQPPPTERLAEDSTKLVALINQAIGPRQEQLRYVEAEIGRILQG